MPNEAPAPDTPVTSMLGGEPGLSPAAPDDLVQTLAFALRYQGRKRVDTAGLAMARITAERLVDHLEACGYVVMRRPPKPNVPDLAYGPSAGRARDSV